MHRSGMLGRSTSDVAAAPEHGFDIAGIRCTAPAGLPLKLQFKNYNRDIHSILSLKTFI